MHVLLPQVKLQLSVLRSFQFAVLLTHCEGSDGCVVLTNSTLCSISVNTNIAACATSSRDDALL